MFNCFYKCTLFLLLVCSIPCTGFSQSVSVTPNNTTFNITSGAQLSANNTISSSFSIVTSSQNWTYSINAAVTAKSFNPSSTTFSALPLNVRFNSGSSSGQVPGALQLNESPVITTLITNAPSTGKNTDYFNYDLILLPLNYSTPPGVYVFTVTIQMSTSNNKTSTSTFNITVNVQNILSMNIIQNSPTIVNFGSSGAYTNGVSLTNFHSVQVASNNPWVMSVAAQSPFFTSASQGASTNMPCSIVGIRTSGGNLFTPLSTNGVSLASGSAGDALASGNSKSFDLSFSPGYDYNPGIYNISLIYTITKQ